MDTSELYIKMCDCDEIQEPKRKGGLVHGDYFYSPTYRDWDIVYDKNKCYRFGIINDTTWLPRQDQIQEMILKYDYHSPFMQLCRWSEWTYVIDKEYFDKFTSMEQLWLAFYMKKKHGKVWDNGWV